MDNPRTSNNPLSDATLMYDHEKFHNNGTSVNALFADFHVANLKTGPVPWNRDRAAAVANAFFAAQPHSAKLRQAGRRHGRPNLEIIWRTRAREGACHAGP